MKIKVPKTLSNSSTITVTILNVFGIFLLTNENVSDILVYVVISTLV